MLSEDEEEGESESAYTDSPEGILTAAGFDEDQAAALVSAMRAYYEGEEEPPPSKKGKGADLAIVFGSPKKK